MEKIYLFQPMDGGMWYSQAYGLLRLSHHCIHSPYEKSVVEMTIQYIAHLW